MNETNDNWWSDSIVFSARTDVGMRRSNNQDSYRVSPAPSPRLWLNRGHLFVVADGMGAHAAGEHASKLAVDVVSQSYLKRTNEPQVDSLRDSILEAHMTIKRKGESDDAFYDMGTTCDALVLTQGRAYIGHVGDSRVYRLRNRSFEQLTFDHSLVWEIKYSPNSHYSYRTTNGSIPKNVITRSLGPTDNLVVALEGPFETKPGDVFLLCSDGLSGQFLDTEIGQILQIFQPEEATEALVNLAKLRGGPDNITVVVARVKSNPNFEELERELEKEEKKYEKRPPLTTAAWACASLASVCAFVALGSCVAGEGRWQTPVFWGAACLALMTFGAFLFLARRTLFGLRAKNAAKDEPLGRAPYVRVSATPSAEFCEKIDDVCGQLCDAVRAQPLFQPDWDGVAKARTLAENAYKDKIFDESIRANISVVNYMMRELGKIKAAKKE